MTTQGLFLDSKRSPFGEVLSFTPFIAGIARNILKSSLDLPSEGCLQIPEEEKKVFQDLSKSLIVFIRDLIGKSYSEKEPPQRFLKETLFEKKDTEFSLNTKGRLLFALLDDADPLDKGNCCQILTSFASEMLAQIFFHLKRELEQGTLAIPPELLDPEAPHRMEKISSFLLKHIIDDKNPPLPPLFEPFREIVFHLFVKSIETKVGDTVANTIDRFFQTAEKKERSTPQPRVTAAEKEKIDLSPLQPYLDTIVKDLKVSMLDSALGGAHLTRLLNRAKIERNKLTAAGLDKNALNYLERLLDEFCSLQFPTNEKKIAPLLKANLFIVLHHLLTKGASIGDFLDELRKALDLVQQDISKPEEKTDQIAPLPILTTNIIASLQALLPEINELELPFIPKDSSGKINDTMQKQLNDILSAFLRTIIQKGLEKFEERLSSFFERVFFTNPLFRAVSSIASPLFIRLTLIKTKIKYPKKNAKNLSYSIYLFIKTLLPDSKIPEFVINKFISYAMPYLEIPATSILNNILLVAQEKELTIKTFVEKPQESKEEPPLFPLGDPFRKFVRAILTLPENESLQLDPKKKIALKNQIIKKIKMLFFAVVGLILPRLLLGKRKKKNETTVRDVSDKIMQSIRALRSLLTKESPSQ